MLHAVGRGIVPNAPPSRPKGRAHIFCKVSPDALLAQSALSDEAFGDLVYGSRFSPPPSTFGEAPLVPERPMAGRITPAKLAGLSTVLRLPMNRVELLLRSSPPAVWSLEPHQVAQRLQQLCTGLGVRPKQAAFIATKQPAYMLLTPLEDIRAKIAELAATLQVPPAAVLRAALTVPSILSRRTSTIQRRVEAYSELLKCSTLDVLHVLARGPEYLSDTPSSVKQRMIALGQILRRPKCTIAAMLRSRPDLAFMSGQVLNTKVNGLMCILSKEKRHVVTLLVKVPSLLRCDLDRARNAFQGLQVLLRKREGFAYAMVCHAPVLLLLTPRSLHQRCAALQRCLSGSAEWQEQFGQLRPPGVAQLLLNSRGCLSVMMYLSDRRRAGAASLAELLARGSGCGPEQALGDRWPDFLAWMERRRQYMAMRAQQRRAVLRPWSVPGLAQAQNGAGSSAQAARSADVGQQQQQVAGRTEQAVATVGGSTEAGRKLDEAQHVLVVAGSRAASVARPAGDSVRNDPSDSSGINSGNSISSSTLPGVRGSEEGAQSVGTQLLEGSEDAAQDRRQQPGASTSGRQPSWQQLRAEYLRVQRRARRKSEPAKFGKTAPAKSSAPKQQGLKHGSSQGQDTGSAIGSGLGPAGLTEHVGSPRGLQGAAGMVQHGAAGVIVVEYNQASQTEESSPRASSVAPGVPAWLGPAGAGSAGTSGAAAGDLPSASTGLRPDSHRQHTRPHDQQGGVLTSLLFRGVHHQARNGRNKRRRASGVRSAHMQDSAVHALCAAPQQLHHRPAAGTGHTLDVSLASDLGADGVAAAVLAAGTAGAGDVGSSHAAGEVDVLQGGLWLHTDSVASGVGEGGHGLRADSSSAGSGVDIGNHVNGHDGKGRSGMYSGSSSRSLYIPGHVSQRQDGHLPLPPQIPVVSGVQQGEEGSEAGSATGNGELGMRDVQVLERDEHALGLQGRRRVDVLEYGTLGAGQAGQVLESAVGAKAPR